MSGQPYPHPNIVMKLSIWGLNKPARLYSRRGTSAQAVPDAVTIYTVEVRMDCRTTVKSPTYCIAVETVVYDAAIVCRRATACGQSLITMALPSVKYKYENCASTPKIDRILLPSYMRHAVILCRPCRG